VVSILNKIALIRDKICRKRLRRYIDTILTYSKDEEIFNIPTIQLSNTINNTIVKKKATYTDGVINVIAVANFSFWHGYDRFLKGLSEYYSCGGTQNIKLHL